jgi:nucleoside-diphosphate-sugar epimerase
VPAVIISLYSSSISVAISGVEPEVTFLMSDILRFLSPVVPFRILNIGNARKIYLLDFINALEKELGTKAIRNYMPMQKGDVKITLSDTTLLKKLTGYNPKTNYKNGIRKFLKWYLDYYKNLSR